MARLPLRIAAASFVLLLGGGLVFLSTTDKTMSETPSDQPADSLAVVRAAVGARLSRVQDASTYPLDVTGRNDTADFIIEEPVVFEYGGDAADDALSFRLPPTRFVWLSQTAGVVHSVNTSPQIQFADFEGAYQLAGEVAATIDATAWTRAEHTPITKAELRRAFADPQTRETARFTLDQWTAGSVEMSLTLKRLFVAGSNRAQAAGVEADGYLIDISITDVDLGVQLMDDAYARRREAGDEYTPLPLSVWLDEQD